MLAFLAVPTPTPRLLGRVRWYLRVKRYSIRTERTYLDWIKRYILLSPVDEPSGTSKP